jgi:hypothetical protein
MNKKTYEQAQYLDTRINDMESAIARVEDNKQGCNGLPINLHFCYDEDYEDLKKAVIKYLKDKKDKINK